MIANFIANAYVKIPMLVISIMFILLIRFTILKIYEMFPYIKGTFEWLINKIKRKNCKR